MKFTKYHYCNLTWASLLLEYPKRLEYLRLPETTFMSSGSTKPTQCIYKSESHNPLACEKIITKDNWYELFQFSDKQQCQSFTEMSSDLMQVIESGHNSLFWIKTFSKLGFVSFLYTKTLLIWYQ